MLGQVFLVGSTSDLTQLWGLPVTDFDTMGFAGDGP